MGGKDGEAVAESAPRRTRSAAPPNVSPHREGRKELMVGCRHCLLFLHQMIAQMRSSSSGLPAEGRASIQVYIGRPARPRAARVTTTTTTTTYHHRQKVVTTNPPTHQPARRRRNSRADQMLGSFARA